MLELLPRPSGRLFLWFAAVALLLSPLRKGYAQCAHPANAIVAENCLSGSPSSEWDVGPGSNGDLTIQGFATDISVNQGSPISFKIETPASAYSITIYRMGYYGGMGARKVTTLAPSASLPQHQPSCMTDAKNGLMDCGNWAVSATWQVPANATSGIYFAHLVRTDTGGDSHIVFIVRNDASHSDIMYQTSDETWQAYNYYGSGSLYSKANPVFDLTDRSYKVSYNRPFLTRGFDQEWDTYVFGPEFAMVQWLESNGYDVTYFTGVDGARNGALIKNHKIYMDSGHDEYWSGPQRANVQAARDAGVNLAFFSGNTMFWKTRSESSIDGTNTADRTLVCYKETLAFAKIDTANPQSWTGTWRDPSFSPPADGGQPENSLTGTLFMVNGTGPDNDGSLTIKVPAADGKMRFWRNTAAATLAPTATYTLPTGTLGFEWDLDVDNGFRPAGALYLSTSSYPLTSDYLLDYGATYGAGNATHHMMLYRAPSGALVFSSGTIDWSWGLNSNHDNLFSFNTPKADVNMQQATVNLFADMGVQPTTIQPGIGPATASADTTPPTSAITFPTSGATINTGGTLTVTGTASDSGGVVGGVEFSPDGGTSWHPAIGRGTWTYSWTPSVVNASTTLMSRAVDDSVNLETPVSGVTVNVLPQTCPCSIWSPSRMPATPDSGDGNPVEVGLKFRPDSDGSIIGVRFYKTVKNTGSHIGHVWTSSGTLLGTATFTGETTSGWEQVNFSSPIAVSANTIYVVSYFAPNGHYSADAYSFAQAGVDNPPLHALANGVSGQNGVFVYPSSNTLGGFPTSGSSASNYWVDVVYTSSNTYAISGSVSGSGNAGATVSLSGAENNTTTTDASGNYSLNGVVNGTYTVAVTNSGVSFTPPSRSVTVSGSVVTGVNFTSVVTNPLSLSGTITGGAGATVKLTGSAAATVTADSAGNYVFTGLLNGAYTVSPLETGYIFTPGTQSVTLSGANASGVNFQGQLCNCTSIWQPTATPSLIDSNDATPVELGVKFRVDTPGAVTGIRFFKAGANTGTHVGHLWTGGGASLGSVTFTAESATGWQQATFATPVQLQANTTYIASYYAPAGHYSADTNYFATAGTDSPPIHALANGVDGPNGVYAYTTSPNGVFPNNSYAATNYWVDVLYAGASLSTVRGTIAGGAGASVTLSGSSTATTIADGSGNYVFTGVVPGSYSVTPALAGSVFTPGNKNLTISGSDVGGVNFSVPSQCPCTTVWAPSILPGTIDSGDASSYELGLKFRADTDGYILGVRFYKSAANTGTHTAHLWAPSSAANPISSATFTNESASGWQQVLFADPLPVSANATYIASYFAPSGHYSINSSFFSTGGVDNPPLHALTDGVDGPNGVYTQSAVSARPISSFTASNYWVDVIYATSATHSLGGTISGTGVAGVTVTLTGTASTTTTTDAYGNYRFSGLADGTYTATPSQAGTVYSPAAQTVTLSGAHNLAVNFNAAAPTYIVSGTVATAPNISVSLAGSTTATVTADASGNFSFPAVPNGTYTITPNPAGFSITPGSQSVTVSGANVGTINFTATPLAYAVSGMISGGAGAVVRLNGAASATVTADAAGGYSFPGLVNGSYTITPAKSGAVFTPTSTTVAVAGGAVAGINFAVPQNCPCATIWQPTATPAVIDTVDTQSIEVGVKFRSESAGFISGIRFYKSAANVGTHQGNLWTTAGVSLGTATFTNEGSAGWQQVFFANPVPIAANTTYLASYFAPVGRYSSDAGFFSNTGVDAPPLHALASGVDGANGVYSYGTSTGFPLNSFNTANYWVDVIFTTGVPVSGTISGAGGANATVTLTGPTTTSVTASATGNYLFPTVAKGSYTVTPKQTGYSFTPATRTITVAASGVTVPGFSAATAPTYTLSGTLAGSGGPGATVNVTGSLTATTTANGSGGYSFALPNGTYTVSPSRSGFTFSPTSGAVTINGANKTANFSSTAQTFTLSGTVSGPGGARATVTLSGATTTSVVASGTGVYSFPKVSNGSYTVTPSKAGFVYTPANQPVTVNGANTTLNFGSAATYTISGTITGPGRSNATVTLTGAANATVTTSTTGAYSFPNIANGSYAVQASNPGFTFTPASQAVTVNGAKGTANFTSK